MPKPVITTKDQRLFVIDLFAQGYTVRRIRSKIQKEYGKIPTERELTRLVSYYSDDIDSAKKSLAVCALEDGLASKTNRLARLNKLGEAWEDAAEMDTKAATIYLNTLKAVRDEVEPLGINIIIPSVDPWGQLLTSLHEAASRGSRQDEAVEIKVRELVATSEPDPDQTKLT